MPPVARCLVIGGNGFLGSHVVDALAAQGHDVSSFDRFGLLAPQHVAEGVRTLSGDFLNVVDVRDAVHGQDHVLHFLSTTDPRTAEGDPTLDIRTNLLASIELFRACAEAHVEHLWFASTGGAIYGDQDRRVFREEDLPLPVSPYAIGKLAIEGYLRYFERKVGLRSTSLRISNPYGTRQNPAKRQGVIPIFLREIARGRPVTVFGDGSMVRDYVYVKDVASMVAEAVTRGAAHDLYNIGSGTGTSIDELLTAISAATGLVPEVNHVPAPPTFVDHVTLDVSRFADEFGPHRLTPLVDGVRATWDEIRSAS